MYNIYQVIPSKLTEIILVSQEYSYGDAEGWIEANEEFGIMFITKENILDVKMGGFDA